MIEIALFYGIPLIVLGLAAQSNFFHNWRFFLSLSFGGYIALWAYPLAYDFLKPYLPPELVPWGRMITQAAVLLLAFMMIFQVCVSCSTHGGGGYHLPRRGNFSCLVLGLLTGLLVSTLLTYLICLSPLHGMIAQTESFSQKAVFRVTVLTGIVDKLSFQGKSISGRKKLLTERVYPLRDPRKVAEQKAKEAKEAAEKAAVEKAAAEKAAAEKAAYEAEQEALRRKRAKTSRVAEHFDAQKYGGKVRDSQPWQEKKEAPPQQEKKSGTAGVGKTFRTKTRGSAAPSGQKVRPSRSK